MARFKRRGVTLDAMSQGPDVSMLRRAASATGVIDYRLARNAVICELRKGRLSRRDVCDAHPELLRAARSVGAVTGETCPVCEEEALVHVTFAFGPRLPAGGRCVGSTRDATLLARRATEVACYVVEVCPGCSWNHLVRMFLTGRPPSAAGPRQPVSRKAP